MTPSGAARRPPPPVIHEETGFSASLVYGILQRIEWDAGLYSRDLASIGTVLPLAAGQTKADPAGDPLSVSPHYLQYAAHALHMPNEWREGAR